jgi:hypothetical protein
MNTSLLSAAPTGYNSISAIVRENPMDVITLRKAASGYLLLNSRDRYVNADPKQKSYINQPWNNFLLQKAQALIPSYAKRIEVTEVRFPWYIPNITFANNKMVIAVNDSGTWYSLDIQLTPMVFYTPTQIATEINAAISATATLEGLNPLNCPTFTWTAAESAFTVTGGSGISDYPYAFIAPSTAVYNLPGGGLGISSNYATLPSLLLTLGVPITQLTAEGNTFNSISPLVINTLGATQCLYTDYVDIVSDKLMRFSDTRDGGTGTQVPNTVIARLYLADEISVGTTQPLGTTGPLLIHRQFASPKSIQWDPKSFVSELDIRVVDQYGRLVDVPSYGYPEFQITLLASEN